MQAHVSPGATIGTRARTQDWMTPPKTSAAKALFQHREGVGLGWVWFCTRMSGQGKSDLGALVAATPGSVCETPFLTIQLETWTMAALHREA